MENIIANFYKALGEKDAETMVSYYADNVVFEDPAFGTLTGERAKNMWRMLCAAQKGKTFKIEASNICADGSTVKAHWEAYYNFTKTGRNVHNKIDAIFTFKDGKIIKHVDYFNLHKWAAQALGFKGWLLGGTSFFKSKLNRQTNTLLDKFESS